MACVTGKSPYACHSFSFIFLCSLHSRNGSFVRRVLFPLASILPFPEARQVYPLAFSYPLFILFFSLLLSASVLVVIPFRTGSYQTTSTRWATLVPVSVGLIIRVRMPLDVTQGMAAPDNSHVSPKFVNDVLNGSKTADISMLAFRDPSAFMVDNSHGYLPSWQRIAAVAPYDRAQDALKWSRAQG